MLLASPAGPLLLQQRPELVERARPRRQPAPRGHDRRGRRALRPDPHDPDRARASCLIYRSFLLEDAPAVLVGRYRSAELEVPTTLLYGSNDIVVRPWMLDGGPGFRRRVEVRTTDDSGHWLPEERPDLVAEAVEETLPGPVSRSFARLPLQPGRPGTDPKVGPSRPEPPTGRDGSACVRGTPDGRGGSSG